MRLLVNDNESYVLSTTSIIVLGQYLFFGKVTQLH